MTPDRPGDAAGQQPAAFTTLAMYAHRSRDAATLGAAACEAGLAVLDLPHNCAAVPGPSPETAWRCPPGLALYQRARGTPLPVTGESGRWFAGLPADLTGRHLQVLTAQQLLTTSPALRTLAMVKLADLKLRHFPAATRTRRCSASWRRMCGPIQGGSGRT